MAYTDDEGYVELPIRALINGKTATPAAVCLQFPHVPGMQAANARLIAAAPELLEALIDLASSMSTEYFDQSEIESVRSLIKKATGTL